MSYIASPPGDTDFDISSVVTISVVLLLALSLFYGLSGKSSAQEKSSDLVVGEGEETVITGPEFGLKGSIIVREGGSLTIDDTEFRIYQDYSRQEEILIETGGTIKIEGSELMSDRPIDNHFDEGSSLISRRSEIDLPGEIEGSLSRMEIESSQVKVSQANVDCDEMMIENSSLHGEHWTVSAEQAVIEDSLFYSSLTFHSGSSVEFSGSEALSLEVRDESFLEVYREVEIEVKDEADVPIVGAEIQFIRRDTGELVFEGESKEGGVLRGYIPSEQITDESEEFFGNIRVEVEYGSHNISTNLALPPIQSREKNELEDYATPSYLEMKFDAVLSASGHYSEGRPDMILEGEEEKVFRTYPNMDIESYIHQGNIILKGNSKLILDSETSFNVLQDKMNYRVELQDESELLIKEGACLKSDSPLNVYLHDSSNLTIDGGELRSGLLYTESDATIDMEGGDIESVDIRSRGKELSIVDSNISADVFEVSVEATRFEGSTVSTVENVSLRAPEMEIRSTSFDKPIYLNGVGQKVNLIDVETPEVKVARGTIARRSWTLKIDILNSDDRYVPSSEVEIFDMDNKSIESKFVLDGKTNFTLLSEEITHEGRDFKGNYIIRGRKDMGEEILESMETRVALNKASEVTLKYDRHIPYEMVIDLELPRESFGMNETFEISGRARYEGAEEVNVDNASVKISIEGTDRSWLVTTDEKGRFESEITAPATRGEFKLSVVVEDHDMNMEGETEAEFEVDQRDEVTFSDFMFHSTIGRGITVTLIAALLVIAYMIAAPSRLGKTPGGSASKEELIEWAEEVVDEG